MRAAEAAKSWRRVADVSRFNDRITLVELEGIEGISDIRLEFNSAITALCGMNGVGKTTILKAIYCALTGTLGSDSRLEKVSASVQGMVRGENLNAPCKRDLGFSSVRYLDPAKEVLRVLDLLNTVQNVEDYIEENEKSDLLCKKEVLSSINDIVGKRYRSVFFYEVSDSEISEDDYVFPIFEVELDNGLTYRMQDMGMGEICILYIIWFFKTIDKGSIVFVEEIENYISAYSQKKLIDYMAFLASNSSVWVSISTHSEHVLSRIPLESTRVIYKDRAGNSSVVLPKHQERYLRALGLSLDKKGCYFVEDSFAKHYLKEILSLLNPVALQEFDLVYVGSDSNLEGIAKYLTPKNSMSFEHAVVLDADQAKKVKGLSGRFVYVTSLPSFSESPPEDVFWGCLENNLPKVAELIGVPEDLLIQVFDQAETTDHHDRFKEISEGLSKDEPILISAIFRLLMEDSNFSAKVQFFSYCLYNRGVSIPYERANNLASGYTLKVDDLPDSINEFISEELSDLDISSFLKGSRGNIVLGFDGVNLTKKVVEG